MRNVKMLFPLLALLLLLTACGNPSNAATQELSAPAEEVIAAPPGGCCG